MKRLVTVEDHLGIDTGPLEGEQMSLSGNHLDVDGSLMAKKSISNDMYQSRQQVV